MEAHDIFSAQVETVAVLKNPPTIVRSPYKGRIAKRPQHRPQIPTREEQANAAAAFVSLHASAPAIATSIDPVNPTPVITPPPYRDAVKSTTGQSASAGTAASNSTLNSDDEIESITQGSSLKCKFVD